MFNARMPLSIILCSIKIKNEVLQNESRMKYSQTKGKNGNECISVYVCSIPNGKDPEMSRVVVNMAWKLEIKQRTYNSSSLTILENQCMFGF